MKRPLRNILWYGAGDAGSRLLGFLVTVYLARTLAPAAFGLLNIGLSVLGYLILLGSPGIQLLETRNVAASTEHDPDRVGAVLSLRFALAMALLTAVWGITRLWNPDSTASAVVVLYAASVVPAAFLLDWYFQGKEDFATITLSRFAQFGLYAGMAFWLVRDREDVLMAPIAFLAGSWAATLVLLAMFMPRHGVVRFGWTPALWKTILRQNLHVGGAVLLGQMAINLPPLVIGLLLTSTDVGIFSAAMRVAFIVLFIDRLLLALLLPAVTRYVAQHREDLDRLLALILKLMIVSLAPVLFAGTVLADDVVGLLFGRDYAGSAPVLRGLMVYVVLTILNTVFVCTLIARGAERTYSRIVSRGSVILAVLVAGMTYVAGTVGTAWAVALTECVVVIWMGWEANKVTALPSPRIFSRLLPAIVVLFGTPFVSSGLGPLATSVLAVALFVVAAVLARALSREDLALLREKVL